jgi:hypothetical protein
MSETRSDVLTAEQKAALEAELAELEGPRRGGGGGGGGPPAAPPPPPPPSAEKMRLEPPAR